MNELKSAPWSWLAIPAPHQREFATAGVWDMRNIADRACDLAAADPEFVAFVEGEHGMTRAQLVADASAWRPACTSAGCDRAMCWLSRCPTGARRR